LIECHLPAFNSLDFIERLLIPRRRYEEHKLGPKLEQVMLSDGRLLSDITVITDDDKHNNRWQLEFFNLRAQTLLQHQRTAISSLSASLTVPSVCVTPQPDANVSALVQNRLGRPTFLPFHIPPLPSVSAKTPISVAAGVLLTFQTKAPGDLRLMLSTRLDLQDPSTELKGAADSVYCITVGAKNNKLSYIRRGFKGQPCAVKLHRSKNPDAMAATLQSADGPIPVWENYWLSFDRVTGCLAVGKGRTPRNVCVCASKSAQAVSDGSPRTVMRWRDPTPLAVRYVGLSCWALPLQYYNIAIGQSLPNCTTCA